MGNMKENLKTVYYATYIPKLSLYYCCGPMFPNLEPYSYSKIIEIRTKPFQKKVLFFQIDCKGYRVKYDECKRMDAWTDRREGRNNDV